MPDPETRGGWSKDGRKVKGTLHWVSVPHAVDAEIRLFDHLLAAADPDEEGAGDFKDHLNPNSLEILKSCKVEPGLAGAGEGDLFQFLRHGYFCVDAVDSRRDALVFNRAVSLRDTWAKIEKADRKS